MITHTEMMKVAGEKLSARPNPERVQRPKALGDVLYKFYLPLDLCKPTNRTRGGVNWQFEKTKKKLRQSMCAQIFTQRLQGIPVVRKEPLPGRPQVNAVRFSSVEPDKYSDWGKAAIDVLCAPTARSKGRLNIIADDAPRFAEINQWWEYAPPKKGFVYVEVRSGAEA